MILNKREKEQKRVLDEKIMEVAFKKNLTYTEAKKLLEAGQSYLGDFKIR